MKIAISGKSGCGNSTVSRKVAEQLGFRLVNYTFKTMAEEQGVTFDEMCEMAERDDRWDHHLDRKQVEMAKGEDTVLGSRLAIWVLHDADLTVYLDAPEDVRARRIHGDPARSTRTLEQVISETRERDRRDHNRYLRLYGIDNNKYDFVDLVIDTSRHSSQEIADRIVQEARRVASKQGE